MHNTFPNKFYFINGFKKNNIDKLNINTGVIFRNYSKKVSIYEIIQAKKYCKKKGIKFFLSNNIRLSIKLGLDGSYIPSFNQSLRHLVYKTKASFVIMGSAHNIKEIRQKEAQKVKFIFISSIFKKNKNFLGINKFKALSKLSKKGIIALGGISNDNINLINLTNSIGFAGISYFRKKKAPKKGPF